jgi:hypothetical protein
MREGVGYMERHECYWFVEDTPFPWESEVIGALAGAAREQGTDISILCAGGTESVGVEATSWASLNAVERSLLAGTRGALWHLWGRPPKWWPAVRLRARTIHSSMDPVSQWRGHPTSLFRCRAERGEYYIPPAFDYRVPMEEGDGAPDEVKALILACPRSGSLYPGFRDVVRQLGKSVYSLPFPGVAVPWSIPLASHGEAVRRFDRTGGVLMIPTVNESLALLAARAALSGVPTVAPVSPLLAELLGDDGFLSPADNAMSGWKDVLADAFGEAGRGVAARARRRVRGEYQRERGGEAIGRLYASLLGGR